MTTNDYTSPVDGTPMFRDTVELYGTSQRHVRRCLLCSDHSSVTYVTDDDASLREHHEGHVKGYAEWQQRQATR